MTLLSYSNSPLSLSVSRYYCENQVDPKSKTAVKEMGETLRQTFINRIERNTWLDAESKAGAKEKLEKMLIQVGWPDQWNESAEATVKDDGAMNTYDLICDLFKQRTSKTIPALAGKTGADDLFMTELTEVAAWEPNACYAPFNNEVIICASNLQPPIYDPTKDIVYNYAMMGAPTLGHEMTHGFDANGSEFDAIGAIRNWMSPQASVTFKSLTDKVVEHYDEWEYYRGCRCKGKETEQENTADMGGLCIAYEALMAQKQDSATEKLYVVREYYPAFAYGWMEVGAPLYYLGFILDNHAPGMLRVNGTVREMDEFYEAFGITDGKMYISPQYRIHIW
jgi:predicted metalloendopeptidase